MKMTLSVILTFLTMSLWAQENLGTMKQQANSNIDKKMSSLRSARDCINNASSVEKFKACKYDMHEDMKMQKMEMMEQKKEQKASEE